MGDFKVGQARHWVQEHDSSTWHYYGSGTYAHAACGKPPIPGSPIVWNDSLIEHDVAICEQCRELFNIRRK